MPVTIKDLTPQQLDMLYDSWLAGESLRTLARSIDSTNQSVRNWLRKQYGARATDPKVNSFRRSVIADYGYDPGDVQSDQRYRSSHTLDMYSKYQRTSELCLNTLEYPEPDPESGYSWEFLRLTLTRFVMSSSVLILADTLLGLCEVLEDTEES